MRRRQFDMRAWLKSEAPDLAVLAALALFLGMVMIWVRVLT